MQAQVEESMDPLSMLKSLSVTGGAAAPSGADSNTGDLYLSMNSPFTVSGQGGKATTETSTGIDQSFILWALLIGGAFLLLK